MLDKRYFAIAHPYWIRKLRLEGAQPDIVLAEVASHETSALIKEMDVTFEPVLPHAQCTLFRYTPNLTHLTLDTMDHGGYVFAMPICFFAALRNLCHLKYLKIRHTEQDEPIDGSAFDKDVPSLRELHNEGTGSLALHAPGLSCLTHLTVPTIGFAGAAVPWETLQHLSFSRQLYSDDSDVEDQASFLISLKDVCKRLVCCQLSVPLVRTGAHDFAGSAGDSATQPRSPHWAYRARRLA
jgi:hypothetical protein